MPHNILLEMHERSDDYHVYMKKKNSFKDRVILAIVLPLFAMNIIYNSVAGYWMIYDIVLRLVSLVLYALCIYYYKKIFKSDVYLWLFTVGFSFILLIENLSVAFG